MWQLVVVEVVVVVVVVLVVVVALVVVEHGVTHEAGSILSIYGCMIARTGNFVKHGNI
jgi:hypothetical protein